MKTVSWLSPEEAAARIPSHATVASSGFVGCGQPEALVRALGERFRRTGEPRGLTLIFAAGQGDGKERGLNHLAHAGLLRRVIGGHWNLTPRLGALACAGQIEAYCFPQGVVSRLFREAAAGNPGLLSRVGLDTFIDPRHGGGKMNAATTEEFVERVMLAGEEFLFYQAPRVTVGLIRATASDSFGNLSFEREVMTGETLAIAQAAHNAGGIVLAQVERRAADFERDPKSIRVPGIFVDAVSLAFPEDHQQTFGDGYCPELVMPGDARTLALPPLPDNCRRYIAARALEEVPDGAVVNLGIGLPEAVAQLAWERGQLDRMVLTVEAGLIGGIPAGGLSFGAARYPMAVIDQPSMFDFYDGGGLDIAFLSMAECDEAGNVNVSRYGGRVPGPGGFINIAQSTRKVVFLGAFTAGQLETSFQDGRLRIEREGHPRKFVRHVEQVTFSAARARKRRQEILYVSERTVFRLHPESGIELLEVAPGVDLQKDILDQMEFRPRVREPLGTIEQRCFAKEAAKEI
jgi:propionate CoA-transferase